MTTTAPATVTSTQMIFCGEHHQPVLIEIKVARRNRFERALSTYPKLDDAALANACAVFQFRRDPCSQSLWNGNTFTPARSFVRARATMLTFIWTSTKRAKLRLECHPANFVFHLFPFRRPTNFSRTRAPIAPSIHAPGSGTAETASICVLPLSTSIRTKLALCKSTLFP